MTAMISDNDVLKQTCEMPPDNLVHWVDSDCRGVAMLRFSFTVSTVYGALWRKMDIETFYEQMKHAVDGGDSNLIYVGRWVAHIDRIALVGGCITADCHFNGSQWQNDILEHLCLLEVDGFQIRKFGYDTIKFAMTHHYILDY